MPSRCAPPCRTRTLFFGLGCQSADEPPVGRLELLGELALMGLLALGGRRAGAPSPMRGLTREQLEPAQLVAGKRRPSEGVVLFAW